SSAASLFSAARGVHNTLSRFRVKDLFRFSLWTFISEPRRPGGLRAVVPCQWRRIIGSYFGLTSQKYKKLINRSLSRQITL
ncbi:hypothetical protein, partial [Citrobacter amalonaticus]|uniref:hypothetical protein n=1 Tax=Citrobacter amalonaticus TaxID=35703 RepID=UPI001CE36215